MCQDDRGEQIRKKVRDGYTRIAQAGAGQINSTPPSGCCCGQVVSPEDLARTVGYAQAELAALPEGTNMGLCCGNPTALASLKNGERVLDLGSGAGLDVFLAGPKVGPTGRAIGVDMTRDMLARARRGLAAYRERSGLDNVEFRLGEIEHLPVADASIDVVISNCVINLSPDKAQVWREVARVLKPGGRVAVSDLALFRPLPPAVVEMVEALVGCVAGAVLVDQTERVIREAGLTDVVLTPKPEYVETLRTLQDPLYRQIGEHLPPGTTPADYVTSLAITARKPGACSCGGAR